MGGSLNDSHLILLQFSSRGQAICTEIISLSVHLPADILDKDSIFAGVLVDFSYLNSANSFEDNLQKSAHLIDLDDRFQNSHQTFLQQFISLLYACLEYHDNLVNFLQNLQTDNYVHIDLHIVLTHGESSQLMAEALFFHGLILLLLEHRFPGVSREKILMAVYRHRGSSELSNFDSLCLISRRVGQRNSMMTTAKSASSFFFGWTAAATTSQEAFPPFMIQGSLIEELLLRFPLPERIIHRAITHLQNEDIYSRSRFFVDNESRSMALGDQAACVVILLFHVPELMRSDTKTMQEIVFRYFHDSWIIPLFMGYCADLQECWENYPAAKNALSQTVSSLAVKSVVVEQQNKAVSLSNELGNLLYNGGLQENYVLHNIKNLLSLSCQCNGVLRWLLLHGCSRNAGVREALKESNGEQTKSWSVELDLLWQISRFEFSFKQNLQSIIRNKAERWKELRENAHTVFVELADFFSGSHPLSQKSKNENLQLWFEGLSSQVALLESPDSHDAAQKVHRIIDVLFDVQSVHQIEGSLALQLQLEEGRKKLEEMGRLLNVKEEHTSTMAEVSNMLYAWQLVSGYTDALRSRMATHPNDLSQLHCFILKLRSGMEASTRRIRQLGSKDLSTVVQYHSEKLLDYSQSLLHSIPATIMNMLGEAISAKNKMACDFPTRLPKSELHRYSQMDERLVLARATNRIAVFTQGILQMQKSLHRIVDVRPAELLESGVRQKIKEMIEAALNNAVGPAASTTISAEDFESRFTGLSKNLEAIQAAMECFQDFLHLPGLPLYDNELHKIVHNSVLQELEVGENKTSSTSTKRTFMAQVIPWLLHLTNPFRTMFMAPLSSWYDASGQEQFGIQSFQLLHKSVGVVGLVGIDQILQLKTELSLQSVAKSLRKMSIDSSVLELIQQLQSNLGHHKSFPTNGPQIYSQAVVRLLEKANDAVTAIILELARIGQCLLLRRLIGHDLRCSSALSAHTLTNAAESLKLLLETDTLQLQQGSEVSRESIFSNDALIRQLCALGIEVPDLPFRNSTNERTGTDATSFPLFIVAIIMLPKYILDKHLACLTFRSKKGAVDCAALVTGLASFLKSYSKAEIVYFVQLLGQYINVHMASWTGNPADVRGQKNDVPLEARNAIVWLHLLEGQLLLPRDFLEECVSPYIQSKGVSV